MVRTYPCHGYSRGSTPRRIVTSKCWFTKHYHNHTTMTQSINKPVFDFSDDEKIAKALNEAPAVKAIKAKQGLVPTPKKAAKTSPAKKAGRS